MVNDITKNDFEKLTKEGKVVVDCFANWCGPCKMLSPIIEELASELKDTKFYKLDVDQEEELAYEYRIMSIPTLLVFEDGKLIQTLVGFKSKEELLQILK